MSSCLSFPSLKLRCFFCLLLYLFQTGVRKKAFAFGMHGASPRRASVLANIWYFQVKTQMSSLNLIREKHNIKDSHEVVGDEVVLQQLYRGY